MNVPDTLIEVEEFTGEGYLPLIDYQSWRVAILRYIEALEVQNLANMQRHDATDEVFVLLEGKCILFLGEGEKQVGEIHAVDLEPLKFYNVKRGVWHNHTLSKDASVLIVENRDTTCENSPFIDLNETQQATLVAQTHQCWG